MNALGDFPTTTFPRVPGRDFAGLVTSPQNHSLYNKHVFGTSGSDFSFTRDGAHAEYITVAPDAVVEVPAGIDPKAASVMGVPWTTAYLTLLRAKPSKGDTVMVIGAGGAVGDAAVQIAKSSLFGCHVLRAGRGDKYDVDTAGDSTMKAVAELTGGKGVTVVVDTTGDFELIKKALGRMAFGGRLSGKLTLQEPQQELTTDNSEVISVRSSSSSGSTTIDVDLKALYRMEHSLVGCNSVDHSQEEMASWLRVLTPLLESGELKAPDVSRYKEVLLENAVDAYTDLKKGGRNKYIIVRK